MTSYETNLYSKKKLFAYGADHAPIRIWADPKHLKAICEGADRFACVVVPTPPPCWARAEICRTEILICDGATSSDNEQFALVTTEIHEHTPATREVEWFSSLEAIVENADGEAAECAKYAAMELKPMEMTAQTKHWQGIAAFAAELQEALDPTE